MKTIAAMTGLLCLLPVLADQASVAEASVGPGVNSFEIDGDYGSTVEPSGDITDDGQQTTFVWMGSGKYWEHWAETAYMGLQSYKVRCTASPTAENDRSEQKMLENWVLGDGVRYFSLAFYVPDFEPTPIDFFQFFCQWWQDPDRQPPLQLSWGNDNHLYFARRTESTGWECLYDDGVVLRNHWYHFLFAVRFGFDNTGSAAMYAMNEATGEWEEKFYSPALTLGWETKPDGTPANVTNFTWKVGTYRGTTPETTRVYYDNIRYGRLWSIVTKSYLTGYHKNVMRLSFDEGMGTVTQDQSAYDNDGELSARALWQADGISGGCVRLDGVDDQVRVSLDATDFDFGNYMTASGWIRTTHSQIGTALFCMDEYSTTYKFRVYLVSDNELSFDIRHPDDTLQYLPASLPASIADGGWHHVAATYNRWSADGLRLKLYFDGELVASAAGEDKPLWRGNNYLYIGRFSGEYFRGDVDEAALYNYAMTEAEVASLYRQFSGTGIDLPSADVVLHAPMPNPFNPSTMIRFDLPVAGGVRLRVHDVAGRLVRTLLDADFPAGSHEAAWDGRDEAGRALASGSYFARLSAGGRTRTVRLALVR